MKPLLIRLHGPPQSGKSVTARLLAKMLAPVASSVAIAHALDGPAIEIRPGDDDGYAPPLAKIFGGVAIKIECSNEPPNEIIKPIDLSPAGVAYKNWCHQNHLKPVGSNDQPSAATPECPPAACNLAETIAGSISDITVMLDDVARDVAARLGPTSVILVTLEGLKARLNRQAGFANELRDHIEFTDKRHRARIAIEIERVAEEIKGNTSLCSSIGVLTAERDSLKRQVRKLLGRLGNASQRITRLERRKR